VIALRFLTGRVFVQGCAARARAADKLRPRQDIARTPVA
jgi:hypothetical protein